MPALGLPDILNFAQTDGLLLLFKVLILVLLFVYAIFALIVVSRVKALNRTVTVVGSHASALLQFITVLFLLVAVSLFVATIVIV